MNKKGFMFTFISVILVSVILLAFLIQYTSRTQGDIERTNIEVETMNSFVKSLNEDYLPRAISVSGYQAILSLLYCMDPDVGCERIEEGGYLSPGPKRNSYIKNAIIYGKFSYDQGIPPDNDPILELMTVDDVSYKLLDVIKEVESIAEFTGINLDITSDIVSGKMEILQENPWYITVFLTLSYSVSNDDNSISWDYYNKKINASIPLLGLREPIYLIGNPPVGPKGANMSIIKSTYEGPEDILGHVGNTTFLSCDQAPSFLQRMMGSTIASETGIESLVDVKDLTKSAIDYQFIIGPNPGGLIQILDSGYYVDITHLDCYN